MKYFLTLLLLAGLTAHAQRVTTRLGDKFHFRLYYVLPGENVHGQASFSRPDLSLPGRNGVMLKMNAKNDEEAARPVYPDSLDISTWHPSRIGMAVKLNAEDEGMVYSAVQLVQNSSVANGRHPYIKYKIFDASEVLVICQGITPENITEYEYRVRGTDSTDIISWRPLTLEQLYNAPKPYGLAGRYRYPGKFILVEVRNKKDHTTIDGTYFDWRSRNGPEILSLHATSMGVTSPLDELAMKHGWMTREYSDRLIPRNVKFPQDSISNIRITLAYHTGIPYKVTIRRQVGYSPEEVTTIAATHYENYLDVPATYYSRPGRYAVTIESPPDAYDMATVTFEILPPVPVTSPPRTVPLRILLFSGLAVLITAALLFWRYRRKLKKAVQEQRTVNQQLRAIHSQLNPHFTFNALSAIQNFVNKHDIENANKYLVKFAQLTRRTLEHSTQELTPLHEELKAMEDYIQMEQLRFGFQYRISIGEDIDTEIPVMLLQPFIENAVKHGVATLRAAGHIHLKIESNRDALILHVIDNGKGFNVDEIRSGYGLKLSRERIGLLNKRYPGNHFSLHIQHRDHHTFVTIQIANWLK